MARVASLLYFLLGLSVVFQAVLLPAIPSGAQCVPFVSFFPGTVAQGGHIEVSGSCYAANSQIDVDLKTPAGSLVVNLGHLTTSSAGNFEDVPFVIPTTTEPGTYRIGTSVNGDPLATSDGTLTVTGAGGTTGQITGVAQCNLPPLRVIPGALVTVFSGAAQVFSTVADGGGNYTIPGSAAQANYVIHYADQKSPTSCDVGVLTNTDGNATAGAPGVCPNPDRSNRTWLTPAVVAASPNGTVVTDFVCKAGESRWYRVPILPGQQVSAEVLDPSIDVTLTLFRDIRQAADELKAKQQAGMTLDDVRQQTASLPHDVGAPDVGSPDVGSPDVGSPDVGSPDVGSPDVGSPDVGSPDVGSPDVGSPDVGSPDVGSPDVGSPDVGSPDAYLNAQLAAALAYSDKPGTASEFVRRHTWENTGSFYIRVRGHNDAFDDTQRFSLRITVVDRDCFNSDGIRQDINTSLSPSLSGLPGATPRTLIVTNSARFPTGSDTASLLASLNAFAARREIGGAVVDLASDAGLGAAYAQWDQQVDCVPAANIVVDGIHKIIETVRSHQPNNLQYVVLAGGDHVLPFQRIPDEAGMDNERDYSPAVFDFSQSQATLKTGHFMSQDVYGSFGRIAQRDHFTPTYDVAVGRLVENVSDIQTMLSAYNANGGVMRPSSALVTGYEFLSDSATVISGDLQQGGLNVDASLIQPENDGAKANTAWNADNLRAKLFGSNRFGIMELNAHFSGNTLLAADLQTRIRSREVSVVNDSRYLNSLVLSMGCHSGYNIVDADATQGTEPADWAQAFARQGATLIGGAGYQYGNSPLIKYTEVLIAGVTHQLRLYDGTTPTPVPLGRAILETKRNYIHAGMNPLDEKSVAEMTLYGLPMMQVNLPSGRIQRPAAAPPVTTNPDTNNAGLSFADFSPTYTLTEHDRQLSLVGGGTHTATYYDATYTGATADTQSSPGQPILPQVVTPIAANGTLARGAVMLQATYTDVNSAPGATNAFRPLVDLALTESKGVRPAYVSSIFGPAQLTSVSELQGQFLVERPFQFKSNGTSVLGTGRRYDSMTSRVYYSTRTDASALAGPPVIYTTTLRRDGTRLLIDVAVGGLLAADVEDVFATFTSEKTDIPNSLYGRWVSMPLTAGPTTPKGVGFIRHYTGALETVDTGTSPDLIRLFVQAVGGNGLVSVSTNNGNNFRLITETATLGNPKLATTVQLTQPGPYAATYRNLLHVSAKLTQRLDGTAISGRTLTFALGRSAIQQATGADGTASADLPVLLAPDQPLPQVSVSFAEDAQFLASADRRDVNIAPAPTAFVVSPSASIPYGGSAVIATLVARLPAGDSPLREVGVRIDLNDGRVLQTLTDGFGQVLFDTLDFEGVQPNPYVVKLTYRGSDRYLPTTASPSETVIGGGNRSLALNAGFAEAPNAPDVNLTGDWSMELWFKDENPNGFNHDYVTLINKGDREANAESPYFVTVGFKQLLIGQRANFTDYALNYDLFGAGVDPKVWHHLAATFASQSRTLTIYLDGVQVKQGVLGGRSSGNTLPVEIGRNGPVSGKNFRGKLDDVRLWNLVRTPQQIAASFRQELTAPASGLVANWQFDERLGTLLAYSTVGGSSHTAVLSTSGAAFSNDVHP